MFRPANLWCAVMLALIPAHAAGRVNIGYYGEWGASRGFPPKNLAASGAAAALTHIFYAFAKPVATGCEVTDKQAAYLHAFDAATSVDGVADGDSLPRGNFGQLLKLKQRYPNLKVVISVGGWAMSDQFSAAASTAASRRAFVSSCVDKFIRGNLGDGVSIAGLFDGIDIDWEYPGACGNTCAFSLADPANFTLLLAEFRRQLDSAGKHYLLTIAAPAPADKYSLLQLAAMQPYLDYTGLMAYDFHGSWENVTGNHAPLYANPADPSPPGLRSIDDAVTGFLKAGVPARKLVLGVPFYGHGWKGVPDVNHGMYQKCAGAMHVSNPGDENWNALRKLDYPRFRDPVSHAFWTYSSAEGILWSYDDPASLAEKARYARRRGLAGTMCWELAGDDAGGTLIKTLAESLR